MQHANRTLWLSIVVGTLLGGCDGERYGPIENRSAIAASPADSSTSARKHGVLANVPVSPCGNGIVDDGEQCDDGWANANDRECTNACTFNDCDLDEDGTCLHWPAADVDLYPCALASDSLTGCDLDLGE